MNKQTLTKYTGILGAAGTIALAAAANTAYAIDFTLSQPGGTNVNGRGNTSSILNRIASSVISIILTIAGVLAVFYLIYSGILYITAGGNAEQTKKARTGIINAIIGVVVIIAAFFIVRFATSVGNTVQNADSAPVTSFLTSSVLVG